MKNKPLFYLNIVLALFFLGLLFEVAVGSAIERYCVKVAKEKYPDNPIEYYLDPIHPNQLTFRNNRYTTQIECENSYVFRPVILPALNILFP